MKNTLSSNEKGTLYKWKSIIVNGLVFIIPMTVLVELFQVNWKLENIQFSHLVFYFSAFSLFGFLMSYFSYIAKEKNSKEWENK